jgi:SAM-dependent methyltransferase
MNATDRTYGVNPRDDLVQFICAAGVPGRILDVGCGVGAVGAALRTRGAHTVVGIERSAPLAQQARLRLSEVLETDVEASDLPFPPQSFDCILYADILEHLAEPGRWLARHRELLAPGGEIVASIPNVNHYSVLKSLAWDGDWRYSDSGLLDSTHLRFFTWKSIVRLFDDAGLTIMRQQPCFHASRGMRWLHRIVGRPMERLLAYQYYVAGQTTAANTTSQPGGS